MGGDNDSYYRDIAADHNIRSCRTAGSPAAIGVPQGYLLKPSFFNHTDQILGIFLSVNQNAVGMSIENDTIELKLYSNSDRSVEYLLLSCQ